MTIKWRAFLGVLFLVVLVGVVFSGAMRVESADRIPKNALSQSQILRGRYLVTSIAGCADCHSANRDPDNPTWMAGFKPGTPGQPFEVAAFKIYPANLTPDSETGLGDWTPRQIFRSLRQGIDDEGKVLCPPMPWPVYRNMSDRDTWAIVAYLKSLKPVKNEVPENSDPQGNRPDCSIFYQDLKPLPRYPGANEQT